MEEAMVHVKQSYASSPNEIPVNYLFLSKYGRCPQKMCILPTSKENGLDVVFHVKSVLDRLYGNYDINNEFPIVRSYFHPCSKKYYAIEQILLLPNSHGILIHLTRCFWVTNYTNNSNKSIEPDYLPDRHFLIVDKSILFYLIQHENFVQKLAYDLINDDTLSLVESKIAALCLIGKYKDRCNGPGSFYLTNNTYIKKAIDR